MKKTVKPFTIIFILAFAMGFAGCALLDSPKKAVSRELDLYKENLDEVLDSMTYEDLWGGGTDSQKLDEDARAVVKELFRDFDYEILSSEKEDDAAIVRVEITTLDMEKVSLDYKRAILDYLLTDEGNEADEDRLFEIFKETLGAGTYEKRTTEASIHLERDGKWKAVQDDAYRNAVLGGFPDYYSDLSQIPPSEVAESFLDYMIDKQYLKDLLKDGGEEDPVRYALIDQVVDNFSYKLGRETVNDHEARVEAEFTGTDLSGIGAKLEKEIKASADTFTGMSDEQIEKKVSDMIVKLLKSNQKTKTEKLALKFDGADNPIWWPENMDEVYDVMLDGFGSVMESVD